MEFEKLTWIGGRADEAAMGTMKRPLRAPHG